MLVPVTTLNNGCTMPLLGLGTWKSEYNEVKNAVKNAIQLGYRHIDCAYIYDNEIEVGNAIQECFNENICKRSDLFITSKLWNDSHNNVIDGLTTTLNNLQLDYLDMYLIHWPIPMKKGATPDEPAFLSFDECPLIETWKGMEECVDSGKCKGIGVSNFNTNYINEIINNCIIPPAINQIERHIYLQQSKMLNFCNKNNIHVTCYSPLGSMDRPKQFKSDNEPIPLQDPIIQMIATEHNCTPAQVLLQWCIVTGTSTIPKSINSKRLQENLYSCNIQLTTDNLNDINKLDKHRRFVDGTFWTIPKDSPHTLHSLWNNEE